MMQDFPKQWSDLLVEQWNRGSISKAEAEDQGLEKGDNLPHEGVIKHLIAICFEASLLRDEDRPVRFRLMLRDPRHITKSEVSRNGLQHLVFSRPLSLEPNELRRLAQAAPFDQTLIGAWTDSEAHLETWGMIHSGSDWRRALEGARCVSTPLPPALVVSVIDPGHISFARGSSIVCSLAAGKMSAKSPTAMSLTDASADQNSIEAELLEQHLDARRNARKPWANLSPSLVRKIRESIGLRLISAIRKSRHGGTILILPSHIAEREATLDRFVKIKYRFSASESQRRFYELLLKLMNALAESYGATDGPNKVVGWNEYATSRAPAVIEIDEALGEQAHLLAAMTGTDGAVVLARPLGIVGFGGEISGRLKQVNAVSRALDREGSQVTEETTSGVGTRHRSAYRLCQALPGASAVVVSQDGGVRIIRERNGRVTYWEQLPGDVFSLPGQLIASS